MSGLYIGAIIFIAIGIVLSTSGWQIFSRHDPVMIRLFNSNEVVKDIFRWIGHILIAIGLIFILLGFLKTLS